MIHRISRKSTAPIIVLLTRKANRINFYNQQYKLKGLTNLQFATQEKVEEGEGQEVILKTDEPKTQKNYSYKNKPLTQENRRLLKETKTETKTRNTNIKAALIMAKDASIKLKLVK